MEFEKVMIKSFRIFDIKKFFFFYVPLSLQIFFFFKEKKVQAYVIYYTFTISR